MLHSQRNEQSKIWVITSGRHSEFYLASRKGPASVTADADNTNFVYIIIYNSFILVYFLYLNVPM